MNSGGGRESCLSQALLKALAEKKLDFSAGTLCCNPAASFFFRALSVPLKIKLLQPVTGIFLLHLLKSHGSGVALEFGLSSDGLPWLFLLQSHVQTAPEQQQLKGCFVWAGMYGGKTIPEAATSINSICISFILIL